MTIGGMYFDAVTIRANYDTDTITVLEAPVVCAISPELYERACAGEYDRLDAGEGLLAIYADNGTFRYRLTGDFESYSGALLAEKIAGPTITAERAE